jgi:hypothetical protein
VGRASGLYGLRGKRSSACAGGLKSGHFRRTPKFHHVTGQSTCNALLANRLGRTRLGSVLGHVTGHTGKSPGNAEKSLNINCPTMKKGTKYLLLAMGCMLIGSVICTIFTTHVEEYYNIQEINGGQSSSYYKWIRNDILDFITGTKRHKYNLEENHSGLIMHRDVVGKLLAVKNRLMKNPNDKWQLLPTLRNGKLHSCDLNIWCAKTQADGHDTYWYTLNSNYEVDHLRNP